jgi:IclR family transcriptional regulator, KDG regulon repressor
MVRAVTRALSILDAFDEARPSLTMQQIGTHIGMPKATTFRLVQTLEKAGFLIRLEDQRYCLSFKLLRLAGIVRNTLPIRDICRPALVEIAQQTGETVTLNLLSGHERICLDVVDTPSPLMSIARTGEHVGLLSGATGKLFMAHMDKAALDRVLKAAPGGRKIKRQALARELATIRRQGYATSHGERVAGLSAIAAPLHGLEGGVTHSLSLTGPTVRMEKREPAFICILLEAAAGISARLGGLAHQTDKAA